jgi:hypothetical protein
MAPDPTRQPTQTVGIGRRRELLDDLTASRQQANIDLAPTQIQSSVNIKTGLLELAPSVNTPERATGEALLHRSPYQQRSDRQRGARRLLHSSRSGRLHLRSCSSSKTVVSDSTADATTRLGTRKRRGVG